LSSSHTESAQDAEVGFKHALYSQQATLETRRKASALFYLSKRARKTRVDV